MLFFFVELLVFDDGGKLVIAAKSISVLSKTKK
nr:MAG TPA: hypothetical protein [Bacteriophage sp.]